MNILTRDTTINTDSKDLTPEGGGGAPSDTLSTMPHASLFPDDSPTATLPSGWVTAHCDGGARGNPGPAGYGAVLQDESGHVLAELSEFLGHRTNNFAEYAGLLGCLQWAIDHHVSQLRVISDSLLMVKQIQGKFKVNSPDLKPLWTEARRRITELQSFHPQARFEITHALRHKNKIADKLANDAMDRGSGKPAAGRPAPATTPSFRPETSQPHREVAAERSAIRTTTQPSMLRGFTRDGAVHLLGGQTLPDGIFVKIIPE
jgi:ribonuclease HI